MVKHGWEAVSDPVDSLGPSVNFNWWHCRRCGSVVTTGKDPFQVGPPPAPCDDEVSLAGVPLDCDEAVVRHVLES